MSSSLEPVLRAIAAWDLGGEASEADPEAIPTSELVKAVRRARLTGPTLAAAAGGDLAFQDGLVQQVAADHEAALLWCLNIEHRYLQVRRWFDEAGGVDHLVLKGTAVAHLDRADPGERTFADIDLLIRADHLDRAVAALEAEGASRSAPELRPGFDRRFAKSVTCILDDGVEVDMHRTLCDGPHSRRVPVDRLFDQVTTFELGGQSVRAPGLVHRTLHAAYHAVLGSPSPRLSSLRDIAIYLTSPEVSLAAVVAEAELWRGTAVLAEAVRVTADSLRIPLPTWESWAASLDLSAREQLIVERSRREGSGIGPAKLDLLRELSTWSDRGAYALALVAPSSEFLHHRGMSRRDLVLTRFRR